MTEELIKLIDLFKRLDQHQEGATWLISSRTLPPPPPPIVPVEPDVNV